MTARLGVDLPIIQAPMAGVSTPAMAAAVSNAGALGSIAVGATNAVGARDMIAQVRTLTQRPFNVNLFVHATPIADPVGEAAWINAMSPLFSAFGATPPSGLRTIYRGLTDDPDMQSVLVDMAPPVVSFHFGLPPAPLVSALKARGCFLLATATNEHEAHACLTAGIDAIVAQGYEAGGHRGMFNPEVHDECLSTDTLVRRLARQFDIPVIAAGGIMDGAGIATALAQGASAAQLGTAFIACAESSADEPYRTALFSQAAADTHMTSAISGRPARCLANRFTQWGEQQLVRPPCYPIAYDAGKALNTAAKAQGEHGFGAQWAGQGAPMARSMGAAALIETLASELARHQR